MLGKEYCYRREQSESGQTSCRGKPKTLEQGRGGSGNHYRGVRQVSVAKDYRECHFCVVITYRVDPIGAACVSQLITAAPPTV